MTFYYCILIFIIGILLGSFYALIGERLPVNKPITSLSSYCPYCNHKLKFYELIPIVSYVFLLGRCSRCHRKIPVLSTIIEILTGFLFVISYLKFGFSLDFLIAITFISMLMIIIVNDIYYMVICDNILIIFNIALILLLLIRSGLKATLISIFYGIVSFVIMFLIKKIGDIIFKRESLGGGDIKLMFSFGLIMGVVNAISSIFVASFIGLPISILTLKNRNHEIPFGPYLSIGAIILFISQVNIINLLINF